MNNVEQKLFMMVGIPGSGKSTWIKNHLTDEDAWVSRDEVRFSIVPETQPYFSQEDTVFKEWIGRIIWCLEAGYRYIYMDATHISVKSRKKTFYYLNKYMKAKHLDCSVEAIYLDTPYEVCNERNALRKGREKVPIDSLKSMRNSLTQPQLKEGFKKIYIIKEDKIEVEV